MLLILLSFQAAWFPLERYGRSLNEATFHGRAFASDVFVWPSKGSPLRELARLPRLFFGVEVDDGDNMETVVMVMLVMMTVLKPAVCDHRGHDCLKVHG